MMRLVAATVAIALCVSCGAAASEGGSADKSGKAEAVHLFNGKDLDGLYTYLRDRGRDSDPKKVFTVRNGVLRISGEEWGCVTTTKEYADYRLIVEFKWGKETWRPREDRARDSGVLLHSVGTEHSFGKVWLYSIECQLIEGGTGDFIVVGDGSKDFAITCPAAPAKSGGCFVYQPKGKLATIHKGRVNWFGRDPGWRDVKGFRGKRDVEKPLGQWNRLECIADGATITVILNGVTVNRAVDVRPAKGRIQVQAEGAEIFVRRLDLIPLRGKAR